MKPIQRFFLYCFYCTLACFTKNTTVYAETDSENTNLAGKEFYRNEKNQNNIMVKVKHESGEQGFHPLCYTGWAASVGCSNSDEVCSGYDALTPANYTCNMPDIAGVDPDNCQSCTYHRTTGYNEQSTGQCTWSCTGSGTTSAGNCLNGGYQLETAKNDPTGYLQCSGGYYLAAETGEYPNNPNAGCLSADKKDIIPICRPCPRGMYTGSYSHRAFEQVSNGLYVDIKTGEIGIQTCTVFPLSKGVEDEFGYFTFSNPQDLKGTIGCTYLGTPINDKGSTYKGTGVDEYDY